MGHEEGYSRYFAYLNLFMAAMLLLVLGNNFLVMFVGWEGVGLCSYLLIGFYYDQPVPPAAGKKAFIVNRIGDFAFLVGLFALFAQVRHAHLQRDLPAHRRRTRSLVTGEYVLGLLARRLRGPLLLRGRHGQERADSALRLAAGRHGRPDAGFGPHPRGHHGHGRRLHGGALERDLSAGARRLAVRGGHRRGHGDLRGHHRHRADGHQEGARLLHRLPARLHVPGRRHGGLHGGSLPRDDACLLQSPALPRLGLGDPCHGWRAGHAADGRPEEVHAGHPLDVLDRRAGHRRQYPASPASSARTRSSTRPPPTTSGCSGPWA